MNQVIYVNGNFFPREKAVISVLDHSFLYGNGVFETMRSYGGKILFIERHIKRLYRSAEVIFLNIGQDKKVLERALYETLERNSYQDAYIRITVSRGEGEPGLDPRLCEKPNIVIYAKPFSPYPEEWYKKGVSVAVVSTRKPVSGSIGIPLKSCNYLYNFLARREAQSKGRFEGIMLSYEGFVTEGTVSNIFIIRNKEVITPTSGEDVLDGVTRQTIIEICKREEIPFAERKFTPESLYEADECFITNTSFEVLPVTTIDQKKIGPGSVGEFTALLDSYYRDEVERNIQ